MRDRHHIRAGADDDFNLRHPTEIAEAVKQEFIAQGGYFLSQTEMDAVARVLVTPQRLPNPALVGKSTVSPTRGNRGISITRRNRIEEWSMGYPFESFARSFILGTRSRISARISTNLHTTL